MESNDVDQHRRAHLATISALMVVASFVAGKAARDAILLSRFKIESLPQFIAISAALALPIILVAGKLMHRWGPARLVPAMNLISGALAIGEYALIGGHPRLIAIVVFFHLSIVSAVLVSGFWSIVNERFDIQSAKRYIGRIGVGATLGGILGGVIAERSAVYLPADAILLVLAGLQIVCAGLLYAFGRARGVTASPLPHTPSGIWSGLGVVSRSQLLRTIAALVVLGAVSGGVMDYVFKANIVHASSKEGLLRGLAVFYTVTNIVTAIIQLAVCGPVIASLGVPRSVGTLPVTVTAFGVLALAVPGAATSAIARAAELVTRNSFYRAGYELLYAPLPEEHKRPAKVVLDVGADKIGDILGAQLVALIVYLAVDPREGLLVATVIAGAVTVLVAFRLPRMYSKALEASLLSRAAEVMASGPTATGTGPVAQPEPWVTLSGFPQLGEVGDVVPVRLRGRRSRPRAATPPPPPPKPAPAARAPDRLAAAIAELRSGDPARVQRELATPIGAELAVITIELVANDDLARPALDALAALAPRCTGMLVDALLDAERPARLRGRLATVLLRGEPQLATWGLWRGLQDPSFEVRYRCGAALSRLAADGHVTNLNRDEVFDAVRRELLADPGSWRDAKLTEDLIAVERAEADEADLVADTGLGHLFRVLGLALPPEPLRVALHAVRTDDASLRGTALEYLETILPADVRAKLWPLLEHSDDGAAAAVTDAVPALKQRAEESDPGTRRAPAVDGAVPEPVPEPPPASALPPPRKRSADELATHLRTALPDIAAGKRRAKPTGPP